MKKSFKRIASLVLAFSMLCTMAPAAFAVDDPGVMNPATGVTGELTEGNSNESGAPVENGDSGSGSEDAGGGEEDPDPSGSNSNESEGVQDGMTAPNAAETPADPAPAPDVTAPADDPLADNAVDPGVPVANANPHYYVANDKAGGDDNANTGEQGSPFMTLNKAIEVAQAAGAKSLTITLLSDIRLSQQFDLTASFPITIESDGNHKIQFVGTQSIGTDAGLFAVTNGAEVTFRNITLEGSTGDFDGRVLYAANGGTITLENAVVRKGLVNNTNTAVGGAGAYAADRGTILVRTGTVFEQNKTTAGGGAIFVADGGTVEISNDAALRNNNANLGGAVYADEQTKAYGGLRISGTVSISGNKATVNGAGMYICKNAKASVQGDVTIHGNQIGAEENNVYLAADATLDISGATTGANIGITPDPSVAYRLVSKPNGHTIAPTKNGDEKGWSDDTGVWDIRYMLYKGQPGLYLYYKTLGMTFEDVTTLTGISGKDINGETKDFLNGGMPNCNVAGSKLTVADSVAKNTPEDDDLTITFTADKNNYRIPTQDVVHVTSGGQEIPFTYNPDFANGTATITIDDAEIDKLTADLAFTITAEKYYTLKLKMEGPLYAMTTDITGLTEDVIVLSEHNKVGTTATYKLTQAGKPVFGVKISLYPEGDLGQAAVIATTNDEGIANFTGLNEHKNYEPFLAYERDYRVITRDRMVLNLSTLDGQTLAQDYVCTPTDVVTYDAGQKTAVITGLAADTTVTFSVEGVKDKIYFHGNEGDATSAPAVLSMESKDMPEAAHTYGELATASLTGYTFLGWFTDPVAGDKVDSNTPYATGTSARDLYAHWQANDDTQYTVKHWVEYVANGKNVGWDRSSETKQDGGKTYYLYETSHHNDGVSDQIKDITALDLKDMTSAEASWWVREGFTARFEENCKVLANGSAAFSIYYDRNIYDLIFDASGAGTVTSTDKFDNKGVKFGDAMGELPTPHLPGYSFGGWYDADQLVTRTTIYTKTQNTDLTAHWNANDDTKWAIKIAVQDLTCDPDTGIYSAADTYTEYLTVYKNNRDELLSAKLQGTSDTEHEFNIADIDALTIVGFNYVGYANTYDKNAAGMTPATDKAVVVVKPTDMSTELDGEYNEAFDGGIVWLYYNRKTAEVKPDPSQPGGDTEGGEIIFGGDFTGQLPPDPSKPGYDFDGWVDKNDKPVDENTSADDYVEEDGTIIVKPTWTARNYRLTYVPGEGASFTATDGGKGTVDTAVPGGYKDSKDVTYDQPMGTMPAATKPGYDFVGWFLEDGNQVTVDTNVDITNVIIQNPANTYEETRPLYAKYVPHEYTLKFIPGESKTGVQGTVSPATMKVKFDQILAGLPMPQLTGYRFQGWLLNLKNPATQIKDGDQWKYVYTNGAEIPVYATWIPNMYKYTFDLNDDIGSTKGMLLDTSIDHTEEEFDSVYDGIFAVEAIRPGYIFDGWALTEDGEVLTAKDLVGIAKDTTVYAQWTPKKYDVTFIMKGATMPEEFHTRHADAVRDEQADTWTIKVDFDSVYGALPVPTKADSVFHGWLANAENWTAIHNNMIKELPQYIDHLDEKGITLKAVVEPLITFDPKDGTFDDGTNKPKVELQTDITVLPNVNKPDYEFEGWVDEKKPDQILGLEDVKNLEEPTVLVPKWAAKVTFHANGGTMPLSKRETYTVGLNKLTYFPTAIRNGYVFAGWFTAATNGTQVTLAGLKADNKPVTVYAHWTERSTGGGGGGGSIGGGAAPAPSYTITVVEDKGADVTPDGKVKVPGGTDKKFEIKAENGYVVTDVLVDGKTIGVVKDYTFKKVDKDHTLEVKVGKMLTGDHISYINGYPDGGVHPEANITRAEVAAIFYRLLTDDARKQYEVNTSKFADANATWASKEIATLSNAGILDGYPDGSFRPNDKITRAEFAAVSARFDKLEAGKMTFTDVSAAHWAYKAIASAAEKGWVSGYSDGTFRPENKITRSEVVKIVNAVLNRICDKEYVNKNVSKLTNFNDIRNAHWAYYEIMEAANAHDYERVGDTETWTGLKK